MLRGVDKAYHAVYARKKAVINSIIIREISDSH